MFKSALISVALCALVCVALAKVEESEEVKQGATNAFNNGLAKFSNALTKGDIAVPKPGPSKATIYSLYSKGLTSLGGGKPHLVEQYNKHQYPGVITTKVPEDHHIISDKLTPKETAELTKPRPTFQYTTDQVFIP